MINRYLCLLCFSTAGFVANPAQAQPVPPTPAEVAALRRLEPQRTTQAGNYLLEIRGRHGLDERYTFKHTTSITDPYGTYHGRFREYFNGIRVMGGNAIVHIGRNGQVMKPTLKLFGNVPVATTPAISQADAIARAKAVIDPAARMTDLETSDVELLIYVSLMPVDRGARPTDPSHRQHDFIPRSFTLGWQVCVDSDSQSTYFLIDAQNGLVVRQESPSSSYDAAGTGDSFFHGPVKFTHKNVGGDKPFAMADPLRGGEGGNVFLNANRGTSFKATSYSTYRNNDSAWGNGVRDDGTAVTDSPAGQTAAVDAFYAVSKTWDLLGMYGRNGFDDAGSRVKARIHWREKAGEHYGDAKWMHHSYENRRGLFLGDGKSSTSVRTIGHELGHGVWYSRFGFMFSENQIHKGLNEGQADIMGSLTEYFAWKAPGENTKFTRMDGEWQWDSRMIDPESYAAGKKLQGYRYHTSGLEDKEEHVVGAILGHMFIFLADGATSDKNSTLSSMYLPHGFSGIGVEAAGHLWYWAMAAYYPEYGEFYDMRDAFLAAADSPYTPAHHKDAVNAAFAGIGVGSMPHTGADGKAPTIQSLTVKVDELNSFAMVEAEVTDNYLMGRVEVYLDGSLAFSDYKLPYGGPLSLVSLPKGPHSVFIRAFDVLGFQTGSSMHNFYLGGPEKQIVKNGGFEWDGDWTFFSANNPISFSTDASFAGKRYLRLTGGTSVWQDVVIPPAAVGTALRYRVRYEGHDYDGFQDQKLHVELRDPVSLKVLKTFATHAEGEETFENPLTRTYRQMVIPIAEKGHYRLQFRVENGTSHRFKIDNVRVTFTEPVTAKVKATAREEEETVEFGVALTGIEQSEIKSVQYFLDDAFEKGEAAIAGGGTWPSFRRIVSTKTMSAKMHAVVAVVKYLNNTIAVKAGTYFTVTKPANLIKNGDFESNPIYWISNGPGAKLTEKLLDGPNPCFLGNRCFQMGGKGAGHTSYLQQMFNINGLPAGGSLHYRLKVSTNETGNTADDTFRVYFIDEDGKKVYPAGATYSNLTKTNGGSLLEINEYVSINVPLPKELLHVGPVWVSFEAKENSSLATSFYVDNVSLILDQLDKVK